MVEKIAKAVARSVLESVGGNNPLVSMLERSPLLSDAQPMREAPMFPMHRSRHHMMKPALFGFVFVESIFWAAAAGCFLFALHRIARAMHTHARLGALKRMPDAYTDEEREILVHRIKADTLRAL